MPPVAVTVTLLSAVVPPTMPPKVSAPLPAAIVSACAPLMVLLKVALLSVVVSVAAEPSVTAPL